MTQYEGPEWDAYVAAAETFERSASNLAAARALLAAAEASHEEAGRLRERARQLWELVTSGWTEDENGRIYGRAK